MDSKTRATVRVFHDASLTPQDVCDVLLPLLPDGKLTLIMDRTTWHAGQTPLKLLVLGAMPGGAVIPMVWSILPHQGNSSPAARILLVDRLLPALPAKRWAVLIADREFVGQEWCNFLRWKRIRQFLRIRENTHLAEDLARDLFTTLQPGGGAHTLRAHLGVGQMDTAGHHLGLACPGRPGDLPSSLERRVRVLVEGPRSEPEGHARDRSRPDSPVVRAAVCRAGLDGPGGRAHRAGEPIQAGPPGPGQPGAESGATVGREGLLGLR